MVNGRKPQPRGAEMSVRKIANKLNISPSTVSLALRGDVKISSGTRVRVEREADRIGYRRDAKLNQLMSQLRHCGSRSTDACLGLLSMSEGASDGERSERQRAVYREIVARAERLGYRVEPFFLKQTGMSPKRLATIFDTRRIEGLFCFGEEWAGEAFPEALLGSSVVCVGTGFGGRFNAVSADAFGDMSRVCAHFREEGGQRIGLVLGKALDEGLASRYLGAFLSEQVAQGEPQGLYCRVTEWETSWLEDWLGRERPDRIVSAGIDADRIRRAVERVGSGASRVASLDLKRPEGLGMLSSAEAIGRQAVEMLVRCVTQREFGPPPYPKQELVSSEWVDTEASTLAKSPLSAVAC